MSKGGTISRKFLQWGREGLNKVFDDAAEKFGNKAFDLNAFNGLKQSQAAHAKGLVMCGRYIGRLMGLGNGEYDQWNRAGTRGVGTFGGLSSLLPCSYIFS